MPHDLSLWSLCGYRSQCVSYLTHLVYFPGCECSDLCVGVCPWMLFLWNICGYKAQFMWLFLCICHRVWGLLFGSIYFLEFEFSELFLCVCLRVWGPWPVWLCMSHDLRSLDDLMFCIQHINSLNPGFKSSELFLVYSPGVSSLNCLGDCPTIHGPWALLVWELLDLFGIYFQVWNLFLLGGLSQGVTH